MATRSPDYARADRRTRSYSHTLPKPAQVEGARWSHALREANAWREREASMLTCLACGFVTSPEGWRGSDQAHDELCCGSATASCDATPRDLCVTHDVWPGEQVPTAVFVVAL